MFRGPSAPAQVESFGENGGRSSPVVRGHVKKDWHCQSSSDDSFELGFSGGRPWLIRSSSRSCLSGTVAVSVAESGEPHRDCSRSLPVPAMAPQDSLPDVPRCQTHYRTRQPLVRLASVRDGPPASIRRRCRPTPLSARCSTYEGVAFLLSPSAAGCLVVALGITVTAHRRRSGGPTVAVYAAVTDAGGRLLPDLTPGRPDLRQQEAADRLSLRQHPAVTTSYAPIAAAAEANNRLAEAAGEALIERLLPRRQSADQRRRPDRIDPRDFTSDKEELTSIRGRNCSRRLRRCGTRSTSG